MSEYTISHKGSFDSLRSETSSISETSVSDRLPPSLKGLSVWDSSDLTADQYVVHLHDEEVAAVRCAVEYFMMQGLPRGAINPSTFPLPKELASKLKSISEIIHEGIQFAVVRGLDQARLNDEECVIAFAGVSSYVCSERATDSYANQTLGHVRDATRENVPVWAQNIGLAASKLPSALDFHADRYSGDVLALYLKNMGEEGSGGEQYLASFCAIYNELLETAPNVLETLASDEWPFELKQNASTDTYLEPGPILFFSGGMPICQLVKAPLLGSPKIKRSPAMPKLSAEQINVLQIVEETAQRLCIKLDRRQGDIQYVNNLSVMHARSAYQTVGSQKGNGRHLLRMFLRDPTRAWKKPERFAHKFEDPFAKDRPQNLPISDWDPWRDIGGRDTHG